MAGKEIGAIGLIALAIMMAVPTVSASGESISDLKSLISSFDDPQMNAQDLAFYLASHGFDAIPRGSYAEVNLGGETCKLVPNGSEPGLCSIAA